MSGPSVDPRPLVAHVLHRFDIGGLENGVVNLVNRMPADRFRHAIVALTEVTDFRERVTVPDVRFIEMRKAPGHGLKLVPRMRRTLAALAPAVVHTRNIGALEMQWAAAWAGVPVRVHGEHGWDSQDPDGSNRAYRWTRRAHRPLVHHWIALSRDLEGYLTRRVGIAAEGVTRICNGVDTARFHPAPGGRAGISGSPFTDARERIVGTVGRLSPIKDQVTLARAFARAVALSPLARERLRLVIAGDGPLRGEVEAELARGGVTPLAWLAGARTDVPAVLQGLDGFVLPSRAEGISNTILEAMASGLAVTATAVGGNVELVEPGLTGRLLPAADPDAMAQALLEDLHHPERALAMGARALETARRRFSLDAMVDAYVRLYDRQLERAGLGAPLRALPNP
jgi:sugar transferase (PEP-CTERM/EpsH1 system associated)